MIKITAGSMRGRSIKVPTQLKTRPTQAKLRQALFNTIQFELQGARILDLFAGSGALSFEALSRGAQSAVLVEKHKPTCQLIRQNLESLDLVASCQVKMMDLSRPQSIKLSHLGGQAFDFIFMDPPYDLGLAPLLLESLDWSQFLAPQGKVFVETSKKESPKLKANWGNIFIVRQKDYGETTLTTYAFGPVCGDV